MAQIKTHIEDYMKENENFQFIADQLTNDESSTDKEMIDHLSSETKIDKKKIATLVKKERSNFMNYLGLEIAGSN